MPTKNQDATASLPVELEMVLLAIHELCCIGVMQFDVRPLFESLPRGYQQCSTPYDLGLEFFGVAKQLDRMAARCRKKTKLVLDHVPIDWLAAILYGVQVDGSPLDVEYAVRGLQNRRLLRSREIEEPSNGSYRLSDGRRLTVFGIFGNPSPATWVQAWTTQFYLVDGTCVVSHETFWTFWSRVSFSLTKKGIKHAEMIMRSRNHGAGTSSDANVAGHYLKNDGISLSRKQQKKAFKEAAAEILKAYLEDDEIIAAYKEHGSCRHASVALTKKRGFAVSKDMVHRALKRQGGWKAVRATNNSQSIRRTVASQRRDKSKRFSSPSEAPDSE